MDYQKNAPWTAVSRERLVPIVIDQGVLPRVAAASTAAAQMGYSPVAGIALRERSERRRELYRMIR